MTTKSVSFSEKNTFFDSQGTTYTCLSPSDQVGEPDLDLDIFEKKSFSELNKEPLLERITKLIRYTRMLEKKCGTQQMRTASIRRMINLRNIEIQRTFKRNLQLRSRISTLAMRLSMYRESALKAKKEKALLKGKNKYLSLQMTRLQKLLIENKQEYTSQIESMPKRIEKLSERISSLKRDIVLLNETIEMLARKCVQQQTQ